ncbi:MAG: threonine synthase [Candidatus Wolframiiraptor sp. EX4484-121]|nr:MAG: threonine synthase [Candidatus Wolframiiraptor sp. EX4484-121]
MFARSLKCVRCGKEYPLKKFYKCPSCGGVLDVKYDYVKLADEVDLRSLFSKRGLNLWKYIDFLPIRKSSEIVSLGEGMTPLLKAERLGESLKVKSLYLKDETRNPTSSFKDRPYTVGVSKAKEFGVKAAVVASAGNAAASLAAYSARAGIKCYVFVSENVPAHRLLEIQAYGAEVIRVKQVPDGVFRITVSASEKFGWYNLTTSFYNPYTVEGDKTIAYEIYEQMGFEVPDWVIIPVGVGPLLVGCYKGFNELRNLGLVNEVPKMVGVQSEGCAPIAKAFEENRSEVEPWKGELKTVARSIVNTLQEYPDEGTYTLQIIRRSKGCALAVSDDEILRAMDDLATAEGILAEPASATVIAALRRLLEDGVIDKSDKIVCVVTGLSLRNVRASAASFQLIAMMAGDIGTPLFHRFSQLFFL